MSEKIYAGLLFGLRTVQQFTKCTKTVFPWKLFASVNLSISSLCVQRREVDVFSLAQRKERTQVKVHLRAGFTLTTTRPNFRALSGLSCTHFSVIIDSIRSHRST